MADGLAVRRERDSIPATKKLRRSAHSLGRTALRLRRCCATVVVVVYQRELRSHKTQFTQWLDGGTRRGTGAACFFYPK